MLRMSLSDHFLSVGVSVHPFTFSNDFSSETAEAVNCFAQISYGASLGEENERLLRWSQSVDQDGPMPIYGETFRNLLQN